MMCLVQPPRFSELCARCSEVSRLRCGSGLRRLLDYWHHKSGSRPYPARQDIDPLELADLLPHVFLIDVLDAPPHFRFRLTGTMVDEIHRQNLTGKSTQDIRTPEIADAIARQCRNVVQDRRPHCEHVSLLADDRSFWHFERLALPLSDDGQRINMLLCGIYAT